jgi:catechol 2,3-dioxygenase-like lactoylglutathione lyase family enzyme
MRRGDPGLAVIASLFLLSIALAAEGPKRPRITGVASFAVKVANMADARTFYSGVLGLDEAFVIKNPIRSRIWQRSRSTTRGTSMPRLTMKDPNESRLLFVGFETNDARGCEAIWRAKACLFRMVAADAEGNLIFVKDPEGNAVRFIQYARHRRRVEAREVPSPTGLSDHALHVGYRIKDPEKLDAFYKDILGYRLIWKAAIRRPI